MPFNEVGWCPLLLVIISEPGIFLRGSQTQNGKLEGGKWAVQKFKSCRRYFMLSDAKSVNNMKSKLSSPVSPRTPDADQAYQFFLSLPKAVSI